MINHKVPLGILSLLTITTALSEKEIKLPSSRIEEFLVLIITALTTSDFFTLIFGTAIKIPSKFKNLQ